jgi:hypothetical protein
MTSRHSDAATPAAEWHGYLLADRGLPAPRCVVATAELCRPDCDTGVGASEYEDGPAALDAKAALVAELFVAAERAMVYAGAGISTASGIRDYASRAGDSGVQAAGGEQALTYGFIHALRPTAAHRAIVELERAGLVKHWLQQNHDGLAQRAGFPAAKLNEIHGSWYDATNPVITMSGELRGDYYAWMLRWEERADFVLALGTSFSGLNADRCAASGAKRHRAGRAAAAAGKGKAPRAPAGQGLAVLGVQKTPMDAVAAVRVFARTDDFMLRVAAKLRLAVPDGAAGAPVYAVPVERPFPGCEAQTCAKAAVDMN